MRNYIFAAIFALGLPGYAQVCTVNWTNVHQRIDGFGASSAWRSTWNDAQADMFFSTNTGIGLSLLRNHISYAGNTLATTTPSTSETTIMQKAQQRGALVWSAPWTPASGFKSNNGPNGGNYLGSGANVTNLNYASQLANYVYSMKITYGVNLYAISVQNEPDANVTTYEACKWTGQQIHDFTTNLYNALVAKGMGSTKIIIPESQNWSSNPTLYTTTMNDANVAPMVGIIANHNYVANNLVGDLNPPAAVNSYGKALWETEVATLGGTFDPSITNAMYWARRLHLFLTGPEVNAWHYWWLISGNADNEGLTDTSGNPAKRMYVLGQWSRFVRPNYYRIGATNTGSAFISAYKSTNSAFAVVAINTNTTSINQTSFNLTNFTAGSVTPWLTTSNLSLVGTNAVTVSNSSFTYTLPALSVVTFVGQQQTNTPPTLAPIVNQTINAGVTLVITNAATDTDQPPQTLTFSLPSAPTNATLTPLNNTNAVFTWRPLVSQANTTNVITVQVADNGTPSLSATNSYMITVNPLAQPTVSSINVSGGQVSLVATGAVGPDYTLWASTNLTSWQVLFTSNSPVTPVTLVDTNFNAYPVRFYRIQLGP
jgi:glucuronoarabinoxylan endo-1,4-beta-xylanase